MGLLRLILATIVILVHTAPASGLAQMLIGRPVEVFFIISGFYMALVLSGKYSTPRAIPAFYLNRFARLYPVYLIVMLVTWGRFLAAWIWLGHPPTTSFWVPAYAQISWMVKGLLLVGNWTMLGLDLPGLFHFDPTRGFLLFHATSTTPFASDGTLWGSCFLTVEVAWTLGLEIWFYLLAPALIRLNSVALAVIGLVSLALRQTMVAQGLDEYRFFPAQLCFFIAGMVAERLWRFHGWQLPTGRRRPVLHFGIVATITLLLWLPKYGQQWTCYGAAALLLPSLFNVTKDAQWDRWLGNLSYPLYLVHPLIATMVANALGQPNFFVVLVVGLGFSILLLRWVEGPIDRWRQRRAARFSPVPS